MVCLFKIFNLCLRFLIFLNFRCEHGYNVAFEKTVEDLRNHFGRDIPEPVFEEPVVEEVPAPVE